MMLKADLCATACKQWFSGNSYCTACKQAVAHVILLEALSRFRLSLSPALILGKAGIDIADRHFYFHFNTFPHL
jgi:hypothetical protein